MRALVSLLDDPQAYRSAILEKIEARRQARGFPRTPNVWKPCRCLRSRETDPATVARMDRSDPVGRLKDESRIGFALWGTDYVQRRRTHPPSPRVRGEGGVEGG